MKRKYRKYFRLGKRSINFNIKTLVNIVILLVSIVYAISKTVLNIITIIRKYINNSKYLKQIGISYNQIEEIIKTMTPREFEIFCAELFKSQGYKAKLTPVSCDGGKDVILYKDNEITYVECKRWSENNEIGREICQKLIGSMVGGKANKSICITTSKFNSNAKEYAKSLNNLTLIDEPALMKMVVEVSPKQIHKILLKTLSSNIKVVRLNPILKKC